MTTLVVDASVALKWFVDEEDSAAARALPADSFCAPELLLPEIANALWKKHRRGEIDPRHVEEACGALQNAPIELVPMRSFIVAAAVAARELDHSAYDCFYLVLAEALDCQLITADRRFAGKVVHHPSGRFSTRVVPLGGIIGASAL